MTESLASHSDHTEIVAHLGPLASLAGTWEGDQGIDISHFNQTARETHYR